MFEFVGLLVSVLLMGNLVAVRRVNCLSLRISLCKGFPTTNDSGNRFKQDSDVAEAGLVERTALFYNLMDSHHKAPN